MIDRRMFEVLQIYPTDVFDDPVHLFSSREAIAFKFGGFYKSLGGAKGLEKIIDAIVAGEAGFIRDPLRCLPGCSQRDAGERIVTENDGWMMWERIADDTLTRRYSQSQITRELLVANLAGGLNV